MAWIKLPYRPGGSSIVTGYFNTDHIYMIHPYDDRTTLHFSVADRDGHVRRVVEAPIEVVAALLDVGNPHP